MTQPFLSENNFNLNHSEGQRENNGVKFEKSKADSSRPIVF